MEKTTNRVWGLGRGVAFGAALVLAMPASAHSQTIAITGGRVHPVSGPVIENGTVLIQGGKIVSVGTNVVIPAGATRIDATGKWVTPGIVNVATTLGVVEIGAVEETNDTPARGRGDAVTASHKVWEGFNPNSPLIQVTRNDGITTVGVVPGGGLVGGQAAMVDLSDGDLAAMMLQAPIAMTADIGSKGDQVGGTRAEVLQRLRDLLADTREYMRRRADYEKNATRELAARRGDLEALIPVVQGRLPLVIDANRASEIESALNLAREFSLKIMISGGAEAWMVAPKLAAAKVPVIVGALNNIPLSFAMLGARQENAALLQEAGATVLINGGADGFNARNVRFEAGNAVAFGLSWDAALRAVTLSPAEAFGVADRIGSLQAGREANVVIWSGDPFEPLTRAERVLVRGVDVRRPSRQDELMLRYKVLPPTYRK
ncbi:MAG TPA: amidohydrolase family protein [Gemmatimonadaceae bacterium]|nr:amidohydrolase family protein [Gemmatimonadaceae bacterium]